MVTVPPPNLPDILAATLKQAPTIPVMMDVATLTTALAAIRQKTVLQILSVQPDFERQLINITTPQGTVTLQLPTPDARLPLPNGQLIPLQTILQNLTPHEQRTGLFLQLEPPLQPGQQPLARLHIAPEILTPRLTNTPQQPASNLAAAPASGGASAVQNSTGAIRTTAFPVPPDIVGTLPTASQTGAATPPVQTVTPAPVTTAAQAAAPAARPVEIMSVPMPGTQSATILGATPRGDTVVQMPGGDTLSLAHIRGGNPGEVLHIKFLPPSGTAYGPPAPQAEGMFKDGTPPGLRAALDVLQAVDPVLAARVSGQMVLPLQTASASHVGSTLLFFLTAMGGSFNPQASAAFVPALHAALEKTLPRLARDKLIEELLGLARTIPDAAMNGDEWRGIQLPTPNLSTLHGPVWLYVHQRHNEQGGGSSQPDGAPGIKQTRFVVDLRLSRLGHTQLEGLAQQDGRLTRIDLKLNTPADLPRDMQNELTILYTNSASAYGFAGELLFTTGVPIELTARGRIAANV